MISAQDNIWISLQQLPPRSPVFGPQLLVCFSPSGQKMPVDTQVRLYPPSAQELHGSHLPLSKSPSPPQSPQGLACCAVPSLPSLPPTRPLLSLLQAPWPPGTLLFLKHTWYPPASESLHVLFSQPEYSSPNFNTASPLSLLKSQLRCPLLRNPPYLPHLEFPLLGGTSYTGQLFHFSIITL